MSAEMVRAWRDAHPGETLTTRSLMQALGIDTLRGANLWGARGGVLRIAGDLPSGEVTLVPTCDGWMVSIGCWEYRTLTELDDLIADRIDWPEAVGEERERRRPLLIAQRALIHAHTEYHADALAAVAHWADAR